MRLFSRNSQSKVYNHKVTDFQSFFATLNFFLLHSKPINFTRVTFSANTILVGIRESEKNLMNQADCCKIIQSDNSVRAIFSMKIIFRRDLRVKLSLTLTEWSYYRRGTNSGVIRQWSSKVSPTGFVGENSSCEDTEERWETSVRGRHRSPTDP